MEFQLEDLTECLCDAGPDADVAIVWARAFAEKSVGPGGTQ
jgi:hypothetical protein